MGLREDAILAATLALLPPGSALIDGTDSEIAKVLRTHARAVDRLEALADSLIEEIDPRSTTTFLEDWERLLGLPECGSLADSQPERRAEVLEKYTRVGDLTAQSLIDAAGLLGFTITINEPLPNPNEHIFEVTLPGLEVVYFRVGESRSGESLGSFGDARLTCLLDARKPAHLNYNYIPPP